ncbi:cysteine peptidase 2 family C54 protein-like protein [Dinothrombium tinctorium]|uniref:Cysteine protease n=1 Tax=Dinothrombium tinctorium TaxID=1965070 RepID=A0A3S3SL83_9ACAR|nr:cysteine peptidase 2 family C54 protein-like protein [Dinothrombium tinctorium]RWS15634.1 cysteine peptidase 2 family C54 protein-like protein [Dinothrombium tinctorium]RWS15643.1 cysteine peptidase 2 family C54 protein-like protein [Dinothrombium tinctorium]
MDNTPIVYGFDTGTCSSYESIDFPYTEEPVWLLGRQYSVIHQLDELRDDFRSKIWITYRRGFSAIGGTGPTSDYGWGCMLRCGQMVVAQALILKHLGRDWRWTPRSQDDERELSESELLYFRLLNLFLDKKNSPYSIHQIAQMGASEGKPVGQWFGPNTIAQALKKLSMYDHWNNLAVHVALDNVVIINEIKQLCKAEKRNGQHILSPKGNWKSLLLFIPLRLGLTEINPLYFKSLKAIFKFQQSLGIIGGRPNHALYFIGVVENQLLYLDPHTTQPIVDYEEFTSNPLFDDSSYHQETAARMDISQLDPSIALCFYCHTESDFDNWCSLAYNALIDNEKQPLFEISKERPKNWQQATSFSDNTQSLNSLDYDLIPGASNVITLNHHSKEPFTILEDRIVVGNDSDEEFELLG